MTLNNEPKHLAALKLREQLLNERLWDEEGSRMRDFIWDLIGPAKTTAPPHEPAFGRPRVEVEPGAALGHDRRPPLPPRGPDAQDEGRNP
jgi:hypothetical protein